MKEDKQSMSDSLGPEGSYFEAKAREEKSRRKSRMDAAYPLLMVVLYLVLGFIFGLWHPGWLVFLTIPLHYLEFGSMKARLVHPVSITLIYLVLGCFFDLWHPGWMIFLAIPIGGALGWYDGK